MLLPTTFHALSSISPPMFPSRRAMAVPSSSPAPQPSVPPSQLACLGTDGADTCGGGSRRLPQARTPPPLSVAPREHRRVRVRRRCLSCGTRSRGHAGHIQHPSPLCHLSMPAVKELVVHEAGMGNEVRRLRSSRSDARRKHASRAGEEDQSVSAEPAQASDPDTPRMLNHWCSSDYTAWTRSGGPAASAYIRCLGKEASDITPLPPPGPRS